jgi:hypothetical protein
MQTEWGFAFGEPYVELLQRWGIDAERSFRRKGGDDANRIFTTSLGNINNRALSSVQDEEKMRDLRARTKSDVTCFDG